MKFSSLAAMRLKAPSAATVAPLLVMLVLGMMLLPLPPLALDALFTFNIGVSMLVLLAAMNMKNF